MAVETFEFRLILTLLPGEMLGNYEGWAVVLEQLPDGDACRKVICIKHTTVNPITGTVATIKLTGPADAEASWPPGFHIVEYLPDGEGKATWIFEREWL